MSVIRWEDPPPTRAGARGEAKPVIGHELIAVQLRRKPGEWALIYEVRSAPALVTEINAGVLQAYRPAGAYEATSRLIDGIFRVYARFVGGAS